MSPHAYQMPPAAQHLLGVGLAVFWVLVALAWTAYGLADLWAGRRARKHD